MQTERDLATLIPFAASVTFGLLAWGAVIMNYVWPRMRTLALEAAVRPLLHLHLFRFMGLAFIIPGVAGLHLTPEFAMPAAYGDLISMGLAWLALFATGSRYARPALWVFNVWGFGDLLFAFYQGTIGVGIEPAALGATWFIPTVFVPLLMLSHVLMIVKLVRAPQA
ncbi:hypothetical protein [Rugamonas sp.]|uniref:hypothetical protein n=1 Tax=Rugamonas sp. TaxID=1926287 RepID=UPI0025FE4880|nr:hypothetical protein [Rugamonas sp.]